MSLGRGRNRRGEALWRAAVEQAGPVLRLPEHDKQRDELCRLLAPNCRLPRCSNSGSYWGINCRPVVRAPWLLRPAQTRRACGCNGIAGEQGVICQSRQMPTLARL